MARAGRLNRRVTFQIETQEPDEGGGAAHSWSDVVVVWGEFVPERGGERLEAGRLQAALAGTLRVRSSTETRAIGAAHRVLIPPASGAAGEPYQIRSASNPDQRDRMIEMLVERGVAT